MSKSFFDSVNFWEVPKANDTSIKNQKTPSSAPEKKKDGESKK